MSKTIPVALQAHYDASVTTTCLLLRIVKNTGANGASEIIGVTTLDAPVTYNDGAGAITYSAAGGWHSSAAVLGSDLGVDNAEAEVLIPAFDLGPVIESEINAGRFDGAAFKLYKVNWNDLTTGRHEVVMYGTIGQAKTINGLSCFAELNGAQKNLKQSVIGVTSVSCRVRQFGSQIGDEPFPCMYNIAGLWSAGEVELPGAESDRVWEDTTLAQADNYYTPGMVEWLTGANAGLTSEVESYAADIVSLRFATPYAIETGDTYNIRKECTRMWEGANSCESFNNRAYFRGEPLMPLGDQNSLATPMASSPGSNSSTPTENVLEWYGLDAP